MNRSIAIAQGSVPAMIEQGFLRCLSRRPDAREVEILARLYQEQLEHFTSASGRRRTTAGKIGQAQRDASDSGRSMPQLPRYWSKRYSTMMNAL